MSAAPRQPAPGRRSRLAKMRCGGEKRLFLSLASRKLTSERPAAGRARSSVAAASSLRKPAREDSPCAERRSQNAAGRSNSAGSPGRDALRLPEIAGLPGRRRETFGHVSRFALQHSLAMARSAILRKRALCGRRQSSGVQIFNTEPVSSHVVRPYLASGARLCRTLPRRDSGADGHRLSVPARADAGRVRS